MSDIKKSGRRPLRAVPKASKAAGAKPARKRQTTKGGAVRAENTYRRAHDSGRAAALTDKQVMDLGMSLLGAAGNVYEKCRLKFGVEVGEEVFDRLHAVAKVCRCELCSVWKGADKGNVSVTPDDGVGFVCNRCLDGDDSAEEDD